jgi:hypothetical protein
LTLSTEVKTMISSMEPGALSARKNANAGKEERWK